MSGGRTRGRRGGSRSGGLRLRHPLLWLATLGFVAVLIGAAFALGVFGGGGDKPAYPYPVQTFDDLGREHLAVGEVYDQYNSNPPTSGPHAPSPAPWGVSDTELPEEVPIHNMEHGGVVIWYDCQGGASPLGSAGCQQLRDQLAAIVRPAVAAGKEVLMTPYSGMTNRIALTAWQTLDAFDDFDQARIEAFMASYERRFNPENF